MDIKEYISSGIIEAYVLGFATESEVKEVEKLALQFPEVKQEIETIQGSLEIYASKHAIQPSKNLKENILSRIRSEQASSGKETPVISIAKESGNTRPLYRVWLAAASVLLLIVVGFYFFNNTAIQKTQTVDKNSTDTSAAKYILLAHEQKHDIITVHLKAVKPIKNECIGCVVWDKTNKRVFFEVQNLPQLPEGMQYQLWALDKGKPVDAGMVEDTNGVRKIIKMKMIDDAQEFALTIEKKGGSPQPEGEMFATVSI